MATDGGTISIVQLLFPTNNQQCAVTCKVSKMVSGLDGQEQVTVDSDGTHIACLEELHT